jgi:polyisoprenoid-binding protein YceI
MFKTVTALLLIAFSALLVPSPAPAPAEAEAGSYTIDPNHSSVIFQIKHNGVANFYGRFNKVTGTITAADDPAASTVELEIDANAVFTGVEARDKHIVSPDFLNTKQFPTLTFHSTEIKADGDDLSVTGELTCHGESNEITAEVEFTGTGKGRRGETLAGWEARFTFKRSDFGMSHMIGPLGDEIGMIVSVETSKQ